MKIPHTRHENLIIPHERVWKIKPAHRFPVRGALVNIGNFNDERARRQREYDLEVAREKLARARYELAEHNEQAHVAIFEGWLANLENDPDISIEGVFEEADAYLMEHELPSLDQFYVMG